MTVVLALLLGIVLGIIGGLVYARRGSGARSATMPAGWTVVAVPLVNGTLPFAALSAAARLGRISGSRVVVLAVVQVPRTLGLNAEDAPGLEAALARLDEAERFVRGRGAQVHGEVVRVREAGDQVQRAVAEIGAQAVVVEAGDVSRVEADLLRAFLDGRGPHTIDVIVTHAGRLIEPQHTASR